ncbi:MAG: hypothetical protein ABL940_06725 [Bacteroidia bacterium]
MDRKKLDKNYSLIQTQMKMAYKAKNDKAYSILYEMERQVLEALVLKM